MSAITTTDKPCPKCGVALLESKTGRWCRNGCEIVTAAPQGSVFGANRNGAEDGLSFTCDAGYRRLPSTRDEA